VDDSDSELVNPLVRGFWCPKRLSLEQLSE